MVFRMLSLGMGGFCLLLAGLSVLFHKRPRQWAHHCSATRRPPLPMVGFWLVGMLAMGVTWYATLAHYASYGWILTAVVTLAGVRASQFLFRWDETRVPFSLFVSSANVRLLWLECFATALGLALLALGIWVY